MRRRHRGFTLMFLKDPIAEAPWAALVTTAGGEAVSDASF